METDKKKLIEKAPEIVEALRKGGCIAECTSCPFTDDCSNTGKLNMAADLAEALLEELNRQRGGTAA